jgi:hypothetical protein
MISISPKLLPGRVMHASFAPKSMREEYPHDLFCYRLSPPPC